MEWKSFPFKENKKKGILILIFILVLSTGVFLLISKLFAFLTLVVLLLSVLPYYSPTQYKIDEKGIRIIHLGIKREKKWEELKRCYVERNGIFLSPFDLTTRLENYRGIYVRINDTLKKDVIKFIKEKTKLKIIGG